jgi:PAS domain S-box-containing protein
LLKKVQLNRLSLDSEQATSHLAAIVESSDDAIISKTPDGVVLTWNSGAERIYGYSAPEAGGRPMTFLLPPDRQVEESEILERINRGRRVQHYETVRLRKDGRRIHVSLSISPIRDNAGRIVAISHIARDITERKRAEAAIRESEAKLRTFLESVSQGVLTVDAAGHIELVNAKIEEMFSYTRDEILGQKLELLIPELFRAVHTGHRAQHFAHLRPRSTGAGLNLTGLRKDGSEFPLEIALSFVPSQSGSLAIAFVSDITSRRQFEEQLRQTQKLESVGVLAGGFAHDFNNLLTGVLGNASLLLEGPHVGDPGREALMSIIDAGERAAHLTRQLLAYAGKGVLFTEPLDISELVRAVGKLAQLSIPKTVRVRLHLRESLPVIEADLSQIQQVIMNLIVNGAEAIGEDTPGTVTVTTGVQQVDEAFLLTLSTPAQIVPGTYVAVEVHDSGCGMNEGTMSRIFDPFFTTKFTGRGLGLAAAQGIVRAHKGFIGVSSELGRGATLRILFPAMKIESPPAASAPRSINAHGKLSRASSPTPLFARP